MRPGGLVLAEADLVRRVLWPNLVSLPFRQIASRAGEERAINIAALGAVAAFCPYVSTDSLSKVITRRLPASKVEANLWAFHEAWQLADQQPKSPRSVRTGEEFEI
jgi:Pyruvate/2-oxoacid:ferredoxin oxidoreductase gamma subunit